MTDDKKSKKYPRSLTAPVDEDTWKWFTDHADAQFRTPGAHLRWLILEHRKNVERLAISERLMATAIPASTHAKVYTAPHDPNVKITLDEPTDDEFEGVT